MNLKFKLAEAARNGVQRMLRSVLGIEDTKAKRTSEAIGPMLFQVGDGEDIGFQRITSPQMRRDLNPLMQQRMQALAYYLAATNPFAKRIREVITSYVVGRGFTVACKDANVQAVVDKFWKDPVNRMNRTVRQFCDELTIYGELCIPAAVNPIDGSVRLGYCDPMDLQYIEFGAMSGSGGKVVPDNWTGTGGDIPTAPEGQDEIWDTGLSFPVAVILRRRWDQQQNTKLDVVRKDEDPTSPNYGLLAGQCFYFAINKSRGASRGISELFCLADWLDVFDQMVFDFADRARMLNSYVWDVLMKGADQPTIDKTRDEMTKRPPRQGGVFVHNDQIELEAKSPDLKGADMEHSAKVVKNYGLAGAGLPPTFFAEGDTANRSTAEEMSGPTGKKFEDRQVDLAGAVTEIVEFVIDQAIVHGVLPEGVDRSFDVQTPEILMRDLQKAGTTMGAVTNSLSVAQENGWIRAETAARGFHAILESIGVSVDSKQEFQDAQAELHERESQRINDLDPQQNLADALNNMNQEQPGRTPAGDQVPTGAVQ